jgi:hypothetical protein
VKTRGNLATFVPRASRVLRYEFFRTLANSRLGSRRRLFSPSLSVRDKGPSTAASANSPQARPAGVPFTVDSGASPSPSRSRAAGKKYRDSTLITVCLPLISPANSSRGRLPGWMDGGGGGEGIESSCFGVRRRHPPAISATTRDTSSAARARASGGASSGGTAASLFIARSTLHSRPSLSRSRVLAFHVLLGLRSITSKYNKSIGRLCSRCGGRISGRGHVCGGLCAEENHGIKSILERRYPSPVR